MNVKSDGERRAGSFEWTAFRFHAMYWLDFGGGKSKAGEKTTWPCFEPHSFHRNICHHLTVPMSEYCQNEPIVGREPTMSIYP